MLEITCLGIVNPLHLRDDSGIISFDIGSLVQGVMYLYLHHFR